ncbi:hypothetical protein KC669_03760 [Candidatus Dojkabacteria bacterium]|uniref:Uncharacterized protein n=1 Tax=Candidatus Dojkabacteria bacterium TaxID=2099670 RepID=A0A955LAJ5_9BACT|nr:hypothetical protein [Candidatus Dojkabacteria bacterium]
MISKYHIDFDESKDIEIFYDFHGIQIMRHNTTDPDRFLGEGIKFDNEIAKRLDEKRRCKVIYIADKTPWLNTLIGYIRHPIEGVITGIYGIILPKDPSAVLKFVKTMSFTLPMSQNEGKYIVRIFGHKHREDFTEVAAWMDEVIKKLDNNEKVPIVKLPQREDLH